AGLSLRGSASAPRPADRGLSIERAYLDPETGAPMTGMKVGQMARVRVTVRAAERQAHVAVIDRLPAGVEPVLARFSPTRKAEEAGRRPLWWDAWQTAWQQ